MRKIVSTFTKFFWQSPSLDRWQRSRLFSASINMNSPPPIKRMSRDTLASLLSSTSTDSTTPPSKLAIIDVRTHDHIGGHIRTSQHVPSDTLEYRMPELVRTLQDKDTVVFHCALSQERGPRAAQWYVDEREKAKRRQQKSGDDGSDEVEGKQQEVWILDRGFVGWQEK